jgi:hypothetical protein
MYSSENYLLGKILQLNSVYLGLSYLYDIVEGWAIYTDKEDMFSFVEKIMDSERTPAGVELIPSRDYMVKLPELELRLKLIVAYFNALSESWKKHSTSPLPKPEFSASLESGIDKKELARKFSVLPIQEAIDRLVLVTISYAHLLDSGIVKEEAITQRVFRQDEDYEMESRDIVYVMYQRGEIDSVAAHGLTEDRAKRWL